MGTSKEERTLIAELENLGFTWSRQKNGHIKAVAPDGKRFTFSAGGEWRSRLNQRSHLRKWERENAPVEEQKEEATTQMNNDDNGMIILEEMEPGTSFSALDVANRTSLNKGEASNAITYLVAEGFLELIENEQGFLYRIPEEEEQMQLSPEAAAAVEAMVQSIKASFEGDDAETYKTANAALKTELAKVQERNAGLEKEVARLRLVEKKFLDLKKAFG